MTAEAPAQNAAPASQVDTLWATNPQPFASFSYSSTMGPYGPKILDPTPYDDYVAAAISEDEPNPASPARPFTDLGAVYPFKSNGTFLDHDPLHSRVLPEPPFFANTQLGRLDVVIGDVRNPPGSTAYNPLLFMSAPGNDVFWNCPLLGPAITVDQAGTVEMLDLNSPQGTTPTRIKPPTEPGALCYPNEMLFFGHAIAIADVIAFDGSPVPDGVGDLIAASHKINNGRGRVYILAGHANFMADPHLRWIAIDPPPGDTEDFFGFDVAAGDIDGDGFSEVVVSRIGNGQPSGHGSGPGRVYVFKGQWMNSLVAQIPPGEEGYIAVPPAQPSSDYEVLTDPSNNCGGVADVTVRFGWNVFVFRDLTGDGLPDVGVHDEDSDYLCPGDPAYVPSVGALHLFVSDSTTTPQSLVDEAAPIKIQAVSPAGPTQDGRIGRAAVDVEWIDCSSGSPVVKRALLIGEPSKGPDSGATAAQSRVWLLFDILQDTLNDWPAALVDATVLPTDPSTSFGAWIARGKFRNPVTYPLGEEIVISARDKTFTDMGVVYTRGGQAYVFVPDACPGS